MNQWRQQFLQALAKRDGGALKHTHEEIADLLLPIAGIMVRSAYCDGVNQGRAGNDINASQYARFFVYHGTTEAKP